MSRKSSGFTGANAVPLGPRNPAIGSKRGFSSDPPQSLLNPNQPSHGSGNMMSSYPNQQQSQVSSNAANALRQAQAAAAALSKIQQIKPQDKPPEPQAPPPQDEGRGRPRKKRSRWSTPENKTEIPGIPAKIPANLSNEQQKIYIVQLQIEDVTRKLKSGDLGIPANPEDRSPSPEPIYNNEGKRLNTREYRTRKRLEEERHKLIQDMMKLNENYKPPMDYKPPMQRISEQIMIPADLNPSINFVGLLIGPRGNTLKKIEKECQCKIMIRGKGSVKEGKIGRKDGMPLPGEDEPLHALITGNTIENVQKAAKEIHAIIKQGIEQPEGQNDLRKLQLMELARLNGTLRDDAMPREREWLKPENQNVTNTTVCTKCGGRGHIAQDCMATPSVGLEQPNQPQGGAMNEAEKAKMDSEYLSLMAELGEGPGPGNAPGNDQGNNQFGGQKPPWMSESPQPLMSTPVNPTFGGQYNGQNMMGGPPPWMRGNPRGRGNFAPRGRGTGGRGSYRGGGNNNNYQGGYGGNNMGDGMGGQGMWMNQQYDGNMYNNMDGSMGGPGMMAPPPPPPPGSAPQQPPLPPGSNNGAPWQQNQWNSGSDKNQEEGGDNEESDYPVGPPGAGTSDNMGGNNMSGGNMGNNMQGGGNMGNMQGNMGNMQGNMGGYGNMMGYGMWGGMGNMGGSGMGQPPMPPGPGPVPPPPPTSGAATTQSGGNQWDYNNMGGNMNMMGGMGMMPFGMPPAPPPPPPSS